MLILPAVELPGRSGKNVFETTTLSIICAGNKSNDADLRYGSADGISPLLNVVVTYRSLRPRITANFPSTIEAPATLPTTPLASLTPAFAICSEPTASTDTAAF